VTTPNQPKPDYGVTFADLSYEIGGGLYNYGQEITNDIGKWLIYGPKPTLENVWELMEFHLLRMPLEVLQIWEPFIPMKFLDPDFIDVETSVKTIVDFFSTIPKLLRIDEWQGWLEDVFGPFYEATNEFIADALVWLADVFTPFYDLTVKFIDDALKWLEEVFKPLEGLVGEVEDIAKGAAALAQAIIDALMQGFQGWGSQVTGFVADDIKQLGVAIGAGLGELNHVAMRVLKLEGEIVAALENFSTYAQNALSLGTDIWDQIYSGTGAGTLGTQLGYAVFEAADNTVNKLALAIKKVDPSEIGSDLQRVSAVISKPLNAAADSANYIIARVDPTPQIPGQLPDHVFARLTDTKVEIGYVRNNATTILDSVNNKLKNGSTYTLEAGVGAASNSFQVLENSKKLFTTLVTDPGAGGAGSSLGEAFRGTGFGTFAPNKAARPGIVAAFQAISR
jgi:hypothetical protein